MSINLLPCSSGILPTEQYNKIRSTTTEPKQSKKSNNKALLLGSLAALAVGVGIYVASKGKKGVPKAPVQSPQSVTPNSHNNAPINFEELRAKIIDKFGMDKEFFKPRPKTMYSNVLYNQYYKTVRHPKTPYATRSSCSRNIAATTSQSSKDVQVIMENGWHFRVPRNRSNAPIVDRISLNVYPEDALIAKLDKLVAQSNGTIEYKTSTSIKNWNKRHDPITIYFHRPVNKVDEAKITKLAQGHIRSDNGMLGKKVSDGIYQVFEPTEKDVLALIHRAELMGADPELIECLKSSDQLTGANLYKYSMSQKKDIVRTSPGLVEAVKRFLDDLEKGIF